MEDYMLGNDNRVVINVIGDTHFSSTAPASRRDDYASSLEEKYLQIPKLSPANYYVLLGDVFHKPANTQKFLSRVAVMENNARRIDKHETFAVVGNHDVQYDSSVYLYKSSLGVYFNTGFIKDLRDHYIYLNNKKIALSGIWFDEGIREVPEADLNILFSHKFYEHSAIKHRDFTFTEEDLVKSGADLIFLGHDHNKYEAVQNKYFSLFRCGSFSRGTSHFHQLNREVSFYRLEIIEDNGELLTDVKRINVESKDPKEVFTEEAATKDRTDIRKKLKSLVDQMKRNKTSSVDIKGIFNELPFENDVRARMRSLLIAEGVEL
jgi:predicted phosphodiesterase